MDVNGTMSLDVLTAATDPLITSMMALCNQQSPAGFMIDP